MKKRNIFILICVILVSIGGYFIYSSFQDYNRYSNIIKSNWKINLSSDYEEVYSKDSGESFLGDGERYHIFKYTDLQSIENSLEWKDDKNSEVEVDSKNILKALDIPTEYVPNFDEEYKYYYKTKDDSSKLYIIFSASQNMLYIIEHLQ